MTSYSREENGMTPNLWAALVADTPSARARRDGLLQNIALLTDITAEINERYPPNASDIEKQVLSAVRLVALASIALMRGVTKLLPSNVYAATALVRQMVEVEYLAWTCSHDSEEMTDWLTSNRERRMRRWQPRHMRKRAGELFDEEDYRGHCEIGGHPTPIGIAVLHGDVPKSKSSANLPGAQYFEALVHSMRTTGHLAMAAAAIHPKLTAAPFRAHRIQESWHSTDPAARWTLDVQGSSDPKAREELLELARSLQEKRRPPTKPSHPTESSPPATPGVTK